MGKRRRSYKPDSGEFPTNAGQNRQRDGPASAYAPSAAGACAGSGGPAALYRVPDLALDRSAREAIDLLDAGGRGDVDLGEIAADHVDADEDQSAFAQLGADGVADLALALGEFGALR